MLLEQEWSLDFSKVVTRITDVTEARSLPAGVAVGDTCGGRSFTDNIAAILEQRSFEGWREVENGGQRWTLIVLMR